MEKPKLAIKSISEITAELMKSDGKQSVDVLNQILEIDEIKDHSEYLFSRPTPFCVNLQKNFFGSHGQELFIQVVLAKPFLLQAFFSVVACPKKIQKRALEYTKNNLRKQITINSFLHVDVESSLREFREHLKWSWQFFDDLEKLLEKKAGGLQEGKVSLSKHDIIFAIPSNLRSFAKDNYSFMNNRSDSFFPRR